MSILDVASKVLTLYQADTSDMKAKLRELSGEQRKLAETELAAAEARNKHAEGWIGKLGQVGLAFGALSTVTRAAFEGLQQYGHRLDLEATAGAVSIDKLSTAAGGLKTRMELLEHAAVFSKSAFQLTGEQMAIVERGMWALEERGKNSKEVWDAISTALTKGTTKALEGLIGPIQKSSDAFDINGDALMTYGARAKAVDAILKQLARTSGEVGEGQYDEADRVQLISVRITDAMDKMKESLGKMVVALEPLIQGLAKLGEVTGNALTQIVDGWRDILDMQNLALSFEERQKRILERHGMDAGGGNAQGRYENYVAGGGSQADFIAGMIAMGERDRQYAPAPLKDYDAGFFHRQGDAGDQVELQSAEWMTEVKKMNAERIKMLREQWQKFIEGDNEWRAQEAEMWAERLQAEYDREAAERSSASTSSLLRGSMAQQPDVGGLIKKFNAGELQKRIGARYTEFQGEKGKSFLEGVMGPLEEFNAYKSAFESLNTAVLAGFEAWISGSKSFGEAFREALGKTMAGEALSMAAQAIKSTALGIFSAATGDAPHAALYFTSAAEFGAAAVAFGLGAAALGSGGSGGGQGRGASPSAPSVTPASSPAGPAGSIIVIGDSFAEDTPRQRQLRAQRMVGLALGTSGSVVYG